MTCKEFVESTVTMLKGIVARYLQIFPYDPTLQSGWEIKFYKDYHFYQSPKLRNWHRKLESLIVFKEILFFKKGSLESSLSIYNLNVSHLIPTFRTFEKNTFYDHVNKLKTFEDFLNHIHLIWWLANRQKISFSAPNIFLILMQFFKKFAEVNEKLLMT